MHPRGLMIVTTTWYWGKKDQHVRNNMMEYKMRPAPYLLNEQLIITEISYGEELFLLMWMTTFTMKKKKDLFTVKSIQGKKGRGDMVKIKKNQKETMKVIQYIKMGLPWLIFFLVVF